LAFGAIIAGGLAGARAAEPQLVHAVYFRLKESSPEAREKLLRGCREFLTGHEGTVFFSAGVLAAELDREVNVRDFDVALLVVFENRAAHDAYQVHPRHLKFIEEYKDLWDSVRVFDSLAAPAGDRRREARPATTPGDGDERLALPDPAASFAGLIEAQVVGRQGDKLVVLVKKIIRQWETSKAREAEALVGKRVLVDGPADGLVPKFLAILENGVVVELDVAHKSGETLTVLELTEQQRAKVRQ
jgi:hypothetical protein